MDKMDDFEKNFFLKREVKDLKKQVRDLMSGEEIRKKNFEIGVLKSEISELEDKIKRMRTLDQKNSKKQLRNRIRELKLINKKIKNG